MKVTMMLADAAQEAGTKLYVLGGGWSFTGPDVPAMALAILIEVPWHETNRPHAFRASLQDEDANPARVGVEDRTVELSGSLEVGRPPGHPQGAPFNVPLALNVPPLPLESGKRYVWVFEIDGESDPAWRVAFTVRSRQ
jgi:hypothetical protein